MKIAEYNKRKLTRLRGILSRLHDSYIIINIKSIIVADRYAVLLLVGIPFNSIGGVLD